VRLPFAALRERKKRTPRGEEKKSVQRPGYSTRLSMCKDAPSPPSVVTTQERRTQRGREPTSVLTFTLEYGY